MIEVFDLSRATDLDKQKLPIKTVNGVSPNSSGDVVVNDYVTKLSVSGKTITYTKKDGSTGTITTQDTVYSHPSTHPASMITGLATVATSGSYNDLSNKPSIPASPMAYVTKTWVSGTSGYRVWSDGYKEQWGIYRQGVGSDRNANITLPLAFSNSNYNITESILAYTHNTGGDTTYGVISKSASSFSRRVDDYMDGFEWKACGF